MTRFSRSRPDFLIIGAAKCGTTSLFHYLGSHSNIIAPPEKELAYFAWNKKRGLTWYRSQFPYRWDKKFRLTFEATPYYLYGKHVARDIHDLWPDMRLIAILRDPVARAYSHWSFYHNSDYIRTRTSEEREFLHDSRTFEQAVEEELNGVLKSNYHAYLGRGYYLSQISEYLRYFPTSQLHIIDFDDFKNSLKRELSTTCLFLGVPDEFSCREASSESEGFETTMTSDSRDALKTYNINKCKMATLNASLGFELRNHFCDKNYGLNELLSKQFAWNVTDKN